MTPIAKVVFFVIGLALTCIFCATGGACMLSKKTSKKRELDELACVFPNMPASTSAVQRLLPLSRLTVTLSLCVCLRPLLPICTRLLPG